MKLGNRFFPLNHINNEDNGLNDYIIIMIIAGIIATLMIWASH